MDDNSFSSLNKLIEFGMGMGIAQQMINTMNHTINTMYLPNAGKSIEAVKTGFYAIIDKRQVGPLSEEEISFLAKNKQLSEETFVWKSGMPGWKFAKDVPEIFKHIILNR